MQFKIARQSKCKDREFVCGCLGLEVDNESC